MESPIPQMVIDDYIYIPNCDGALSEISLIDGQKRTLNDEECNHFIGIDKKNKTLYFETNLEKLIEIKVNKRRSKLGIKIPQNQCI